MKLKETTTIPAGRSAATGTSSGDWLTKQQVADILQVSAKQVQRWIAEGKLPASRPSPKVLRIRKRDLDRFLERHAL
jgi:excisionase family DNA binding protein